MPKQGRKGKVKYKKPPGAPKRFKSSYMFFSTQKHTEIREDLQKQGKNEKTTTIAKLVSEAWKKLTPEEREVWEEKARQDKARYMMEKSTYTGPWKVPAKRRKPKDKDAPKRPMSAFLAYSHTRRAEIRAEFPNMNNIDVSRELAKRWKQAPQEEKQEYIDDEAKKREKYKVAIAEWRFKNGEKESAQRQQREASAMLTLRNMSTLDGIDSSSSPRDGSMNHPLVAAASSARSANVQYPSAETYVPAADFYGSSSYPFSYGTNYSNSSWLSARASASAAAAASYSRQEEQAAAAAQASAAYGNPYAGRYSGTTLMGGLNGSMGGFGGAATAATAAPVYDMAAASFPYSTADSINPYSNYRRTSQEEEQVLLADWSAYRAQQQQRGGGFPPESYM